MEREEHVFPAIRVQPRATPAQVQQVVRLLLRLLRTSKLPEEVVVVGQQYTGALRKLLEAVGIITLVKKMPGILKKVPEAVNDFFEAAEKFIFKMVLKSLLMLSGVTCVIGIGFYMCHRLRRYQAPALGENYMGRSLLIVSADVLEIDSSRRSLRKLISIHRFRAVIPICVMDGLNERMQGVGPDSFKALAAFLTVKDFRKSGWVRLQREHGEGDIGLLYDTRMINTARVLGHLNPAYTVILITNSDHLRAKARERMLYTMDDLEAHASLRL